MEYGPLSLKRAFVDGWAAFKKRPGLSIGGGLLGYFLGSMFWPFIGGPMAAGTCKLFLKIARDDNPDINDLFSCFNEFWKWTGMCWLCVAIEAACFLPFAPIMFLNMSTMPGATSAGGQPDVPPLVLVRFMIVHFSTIICALVLIYAVVARLAFVFFEGLEGAGIMESFRRSWELTRGRWLRLWWIFLVLGLFSSAGAIACYIGVFFTLALTYNIGTEIYLDLRRTQAGNSDASPEIAPAT